jgi:hypothetical protein
VTTQVNTVAAKTLEWKEIEKEARRRAEEVVTNANEMQYVQPFGDPYLRLALVKAYEGELFLRQEDSIDPDEYRVAEALAQSLWFVAHDIRERLEEMPIDEEFED